MSGLLLKSRQMLACTSFVQARQFSYKFSHVSSPLSQDHDPEALSKELEKALKGKKKSSIDTAPGWSEKLASASEATVKADRHERDGTITIEELQKKSISLMEENDYEPEQQTSENK